MWLTAWLASYMMPRLARAVSQPRALDLLGLGEDAAALGLADGLDDGRRQLHVLAGDQADRLGQVARRPGVAAAGAEDEDGLADLDVVARLSRTSLTAGC